MIMDPRVDTPFKFSSSEIKSFQRCPKQHEYKYIQRLVSKKPQRPLTIGNWVHAALETHYKDGDWRIGYQQWLAIYDKYFDEEKAALDKRGKLPDLVKRIIKGYLYYYKNDGWKVLYTEWEFEFPMTFNGLIFLVKGRVDLIVEDEDGDIWVVDHKTASNIPDPTSFHAMDPQLMLYPVAVKKLLGLKVRGIVYNYVQSKPPSIPKLNKNGSISKRKVRTDYPTLLRFLKESGQDPADWVHVLRPLKRRSPFLRRYRLPREPVVTKAILKDLLTVATHIVGDELRTRTITRDCANMCSYHELCRSELNGFDTTFMRKAQFTIKEGDNPIELDQEPEEDDDGE